MESRYSFEERCSFGENGVLPLDDELRKLARLLAGQRLSAKNKNLPIRLLLLRIGGFFHYFLSESLRRRDPFKSSVWTNAGWLACHSD
jgi:hypothetical protein